MSGLYERLRKIGHGHAGIMLPQRGPRLHAMITSTGFSRQTESSYDWDGIKRGTRPFVLFQYTFSGLGRLRFENREFAVGPGEAMLLYFPHANRYWLPKESSSWEFIFACLYGEEIISLWKDLVAKTGPVAKLSEESRSLDKVVGIYERARDAGYDSPFAISGDAYAFAMELFADLTEERKSDKPKWVEKVERHLHANVDKEISVEEMARIAGYSRYHFTRLFEEHAGASPAAYLNKLRLKRATGLLRTNRLSVKEVAYRTGFSDVNYFCKAFRKNFGVSPGEFRKSGV